MTGIIIRPLKKEDRAAWEDLWRAYLVFYEENLAPEVTDTLFGRLLADGHHAGLVAEQDGSLVGFTHYLVHDSTWSVASTCYLEDLFVDGAIRGGGIGRKLIEGVYAAAEIAECSNVYWHTHDHNARARQLYDRIGTLSGFVRYDRPKAGCDGVQFEIARDPKV